MSETITLQKQEWLDKVLSIKLESDGAAPAFRKLWGKAWDGWTDAIDTVDAQIDILARAMRAEDDEGLAAIADTGLPTLFENLRQPLVTAALQLRNAPDDELAARAGDAKRAIAALANLLTSSAKIAACDDVDFGVAVSIRATLGPALQTLLDAINRAPA